MTMLRREGIVDGPVYDELIQTEGLFEQFVYPTLAGPVAIPANGGAWALGALTQVIPINQIATSYSIKEVIISAMSANADFELALYYGAGDTLWAETGFTRGGAQLSSLRVAVGGIVIPANSIFKAAIADSIGTSTLEIKVTYHLHP